MDSSKTLREAVIALIDNAFEGGGGCVTGHDADWDAREYRKIRGALADKIALAALQQPAAEPVAWMSEAALTILKLGRAANHTDLIPGKIGPLRDFVVALYASLVPEPATTDVEREEIARVIDPLTTAADFRRVKMDCTCALCARDIKTLAKADQIKALFASKLPTTQPTG